MGNKKSILYGIFLLLLMIIGNFAILSVIWYGASLVIDKEITTGELTSFVLIAITLSANLLGAGGIMNNIVTAGGVAERVKNKEN